MKCILCNSRKGRRYCPAKAALICPQCCGEKRVLEIDCPEDCRYLKTGREHEADHVGMRHFRTSDPFEQDKRMRVLERFRPVLASLEGMIAVERQSNRDLTDADVADAMDCLLKTLRTEDRGVIYATTSDNLRAEGVRRQISGLIESYRYPKESDQQRISLREAIECLEVLRSVVASHMEAGDSSISFVDFLLRNLPREGRLQSSQSAIIIPGR